MKTQGFILYKIYYGDHLAYLGRTKQPLQERIRGHLFQKPMHRTICIESVSKIEYASFATEADMNVYEVYLINKLKPPLNVDDKTRDQLTIVLPDVVFQPFDCALLDKWRAVIKNSIDIIDEKRKRLNRIPESLTLLRESHRQGIITTEYYEIQKELLEAEKEEIRQTLYGHH